MDVNEEFLQKGASAVNQDDLAKVRNKSTEIQSKFESAGPLSRFIGDAKLLLSLVRDYMDGKYKRIPWWALSAIVFALLYVFNPFDIVPDILPVVGLVDDTAVFVLCLALIEQQLREYKEWKTKTL